MCWCLSIIENHFVVLKAMYLARGQLVDKHCSS